MPHYKLTYFDIRGLGEGPRLLFAQAGVKYEDHRVPRDSTEYKAIAPFGQVPLLEVDGVVIAQSAAIMRYLAHEHGLAGANAIENAQIDSIVDAGKDFGNGIRDYWMVAAGMKEGNKEELYKEKVEPERKKLFTALENFLKKSGSGFVVGKKVTWADLLITDYFASFHDYAPNLFEGYPEIEKWVARIRELPNIKKWVAERPKTPY